MTNAWQFNFNAKAIFSSLKDKVDEWQDKVGVQEVAEVQANTPVLTGDLKRSITFKKINTSTKFTLKIGSALIYSAKVEYKNKSYIRSTLNRDVGELKTSLLETIRRF